MKNIASKIIKKARKIVLIDNNGYYGGISHSNETLGEFMDEVGLDNNSTFYQIDKKLEECGIQQVFNTLPTYTNIDDLQGAYFAIGRTHTLEGWRRQAQDWACFDEDDGIIEELEELKSEKVIDFINEYWQINIVPTSTLSKEELSRYSEQDFC